MVTACAKEIRIRATRRNLEENLGTEGKGSGEGGLAVQLALCVARLYLTLGSK